MQTKLSLNVLTDSVICNDILDMLVPTKCLVLVAMKRVHGMEFIFNLLLSLKRAVVKW